MKKCIFAASIPLRILTIISFLLIILFFIFFLYFPHGHYIYDSSDVNLYTKVINVGGILVFSLNILCVMMSTVKVIFDFIIFHQSKWQCVKNVAWDLYPFTILLFLLGFDFSRVLYYFTIPFRLLPIF